MEIAGLAKWMGSHKLNDHEAWRKIKGADGSKALWLEVERNACYPEESAHRKNKKIRKIKGNNPFKKPTARGAKPTDSEMAEPEGKTQRTRHKIWFSKNFGGYARVLIELKVEMDLTEAVKVWYPRVNGSKGKHVNIETEYLHVPDKCTHCMVFGHSHATFKVCPRSEEELSKEGTNKDVNLGNMGDMPNLPKPPDNGGFTLVRRRRGLARHPDREVGNRKPKLYTPNNRRQAREGHQDRYRDKGNHVDLTYDRNIVNKF
ncbi:hypothetical protein L1987_20398 [Smallanthus sonchifolius]|uniref:Uncharacterized protein n=1 Tax=Smallanthus sonchifolius TaxID=185202 RepID=A0ACB9ITF4_9ASTR|nr:hypothetical protein L1987_20398 [Smallanthus sonchifolius]